MLLLLLSRFSSVRLCATPEMAAHQAPPSLGFSRQEHWNGLPFSSPMHESEKWKWSRSVVSDPQRPHGLQPSKLFCPWDLPGKSTGVGCHCLLHLLNKETQFSRDYSQSVGYLPLHIKFILLVKAVILFWEFPHFFPYVSRQREVVRLTLPLLPLHVVSLCFLCRSPLI